MYLLRHLFYLMFFLFIYSASGQSQYSIPNASVQPKFIFPIYFEEGGGERDTLYLGFDSLATGYGVINAIDDTVFGVKKNYIDTNSFYVCWTSQLLKSFNPPVLKDSIFKVNVSSLIGSMDSPLFPRNINFRMNKGILPLKISWDKNLFYNDSLPFTLNPPTPIGQGRFSIDFSNDEYISENGTIVCQFWSYILVTDTQVQSICTAVDSMTINNIQFLPIPVRNGIFTFYITSWAGINTGNVEIQTDLFQNEVYPNPFQEYLKISPHNKNILYRISIIDMLGNMVLESVNNLNDVIIYSGSLENGIYILEIKFGSAVIRKKIIKQ